MTPREHLHQHFGPADRRWIDSMTDERCAEIQAIRRYSPVCYPDADGVIYRIYESFEKVLSRGWAEEDEIPSGEYHDWR